MYYVYILESLKNNSYYIGCTNNTENRLRQHNAGKSRYTKNKGPWLIRHTETYQSLKEARHREKQIKSWKKRAAVEKLIQAPIV
jgi:putative endonuclease